MAIKDIKNYRTLVFDCDGVILNSNKIKTQAFYEATKHYGHTPAQKLVGYHVDNGGISRYVKMEYFLKEILGKKICDVELNDLLYRFSSAVKKGLTDCEVTEGLQELRAKTKNANWLIVSGGDQSELREVFNTRGLDHLFDAGIFGSPDNKFQIIERETQNNRIHSNGLFLGDSKYDYEAAKKGNLDFIFLSEWTEVGDWQEWCSESNIDYKKSINQL